MAITTIGTLDYSNYPKQKLDDYRQVFTVVPATAYETTQTFGIQQQQHQQQHQQQQQQQHQQQQQQYYHHHHQVSHNAIKVMEALEIKQSKLVNKKPSQDSGNMSVNGSTSIERHPSSFSNDSHRDFILNPAVFSHVIESGPSVCKIHVEEGSNSMAMRKAAPRMGVKLLNFAPDDTGKPTGDEVPSEVTVTTIMGKNAIGIIKDHHQQQGVISTTPSTLTNGYSHSSNNRLHQLGQAHSIDSRQSLDVANLADVVKASCIFTNPTVVFEKPTWTLATNGSLKARKDVGVQTQTFRPCRCAEMDRRREKELAKHINVIIGLSVLSCFVFLPIGIVALVLSLKARWLFAKRCRITAEPNSLGMIPHHYADPINLLTKNMLFHIDAAKYCLLAETILIILIAITYALYIGIVAKFRELATFLLMLLVTSPAKPNAYDDASNFFSNSTRHAH